MIQNVATIYAFFIVCVIFFQFCLIAGAPWGRITQGGQHEGPLPVSGRVAAGISVFILIAMGLGILSAAGLVSAWPRWAIYTVLGVQALSVVLNWITPSRKERLLWAPITSTMLAMAAFVVFS